MKELGLLLLGWFLGVFGPVVAEKIKKGPRRRELMAALLAEAADLRFKMALAAYRLRMYLAAVDRPFLEWLQPILEGYDGPDRDAEALEAFRRLRGCSDEQLKVLHGATRRPGRGLRLVPVALPFLASQVHTISICPIDFQQRMLKLQSQVSLFNSDVEFALRNFERTFDSNLTGENRQAVLMNLEETYENMARRAQEIASFASVLLAAYSGAPTWFARLRS